MKKFSYRTYHCWIFEDDNSVYINLQYLPLIGKSDQSFFILSKIIDQESER